jgi:hypothetical protein
VDIELSPIFGDVYFRSEDQSEDIKEDGQGVTPIDAVMVGRITELQIPMTRSDLDQLEAVIGGSVAVGNVLSVSNRVGQAVFADAKEVILKPMEDNVCSAVNTEWLHIWRCYPMHAFEIPYNLSTQRIFNVVFKVFPDDLSGQVGEIWQVGT